MVRIQQEPIVIDNVVNEVRDTGSGAIVLFMGTVRDNNEGRPVLHLDYDAYGPMAEREMNRLKNEALTGHEISRLAMVHRTGRIEPGEISVAIAVSAPHREPALAACRFMIDSLKRTVPIWKRECFEDGEVWIEGGGTTPHSS